MNISAETLEGLVTRHGRQQSALLPILHDLQEAEGHIPPECLPLIAKALNLSIAEVYGVVTFYPHFRQVPPRRHVVRICRAEACQANGAEALVSHAEKHAATSKAVTLEPVYCLGLCASGPAVQVDEYKLYAQMTCEKWDKLAARLEGTS